MKERYAMTEFRKQANRLNFGDVSTMIQKTFFCITNTLYLNLILIQKKIVPLLIQIDEDAYQEDLGYSRGTIGRTGTGRIRLPQVDEKTKVN